MPLAKRVRTVNSQLAAEKPVKQPPAVPPPPPHADETVYLCAAGVMLGNLSLVGFSHCSATHSCSNINELPTVAIVLFAVFISYMYMRAFVTALQTMYPAHVGKFFVAQLVFGVSALLLGLTLVINRVAFMLERPSLSVFTLPVVYISAVGMSATSWMAPFACYKLHGRFP
jgi:hypothetical protein